MQEPLFPGLEFLGNLRTVILTAKTSGTHVFYDTFASPTIGTYVFYDTFASPTIETHVFYDTFKLLISKNEPGHESGALFKAFT